MKTLRTALAALTAAGTALAAGGTALAQETAREGRLVASHILDWERVSSPAISPDGTTVIYTRSHVDRQKDRWASELWIVNADGSRNRFLAKGSSPVWSPDGTRIAFFAEAGDGTPQLFVRWMDAEGAVSQVTREGPAPRDIHWSPDSGLIAFTRMVPAPETWDLPSMPAPPEGGEWTKTPRIVRKMHFRQDRVGFLEEGYRHLFVVPADGGRRPPADPGELARGFARRRGSRLRRRPRLDAGRQRPRLRCLPRRGCGSALPGIAHPLRQPGERRDPPDHQRARPLGRSGGLPGREAHRLQRVRLDDQHLPGLRPPGDRFRRVRDALALGGPRPGRQQPHLGSGKRPDLLHRRRPRFAGTSMSLRSTAEPARSPRGRTCSRSARSRRPGSPRR